MDTDQLYVAILAAIIATGIVSATSCFIAMCILCCLKFDMVGQNAMEVVEASRWSFGPAMRRMERRRRRSNGYDSRIIPRRTTHRETPQPAPFLSYDRNRLCLKSLRADLLENQDDILYDEDMVYLSKTLFNDSEEFDAAKTWLKSKVGTNEEDEKRYVETNLAVLVPGSRYTIACFKASQAFPDLHVNRLQDWYCNPLFLAMAPLKLNFVKFWDLIISNDVGNIAWIGNLEENGITKIDAYIPLKADMSVVYEDANIDNYKVEVKTNKVQDNKAAGKFVVYDVEAKLTRADKSTDTGKVVITHVLDWPDRSIPKIDDVSNLYRHCANIESLRRKSLSPAVLFHCSAGVQRSAAMVALYICRQIYMERRAVNLVGVLKYIRSMRYGAFLWPRYGYIQVPLIVGNLIALDVSLQSPRESNFA